MSTPDLCPHLAQSADLNQPFALTTMGQNPVYACPSCVTEAAQAALKARTAPGQIASLIFLDRCDHQPDRSRCHVCVRALRAALDTAWSSLYFTDRPAANRLQKVTDALFKSEDARAIEAERKNVLVRDAVAKATRQLAIERREDAERGFRRRHGMPTKYDSRPYEHHEPIEAAWGAEARAIRQGAA